MTLAYVFINSAFTVLSLIKHRKIFNPISIYNVIWTLMIVFYQMKLVDYHKLTFTTWSILFLSCIIFNVTYFIGFYYTTKSSNLKCQNDKKLNLKLIIISSSIISAFAIIPNFIYLVLEYGIDNLISSISEVYVDRVEGNIKYIGYFSPIVNVSLMFSGYYITKKGWKKFLLLPIILSIMNALSFGGRNNVIISMLSFLLPILFFGELKKHKYKNYILIIIIGVTFYYVFNIINVERSSVTSISPYASSFLISLEQKYPGIYKIYTYFTTPVGVLNEYLKKPYYFFGSNTFLPLYKQLLKFGIHIDLQWTLPFYYTPISSNVGTYLMELIIDFSLFGAMIVIGLIGYNLGRLYKYTKLYDNVKLKMLFIVLMIILIMSFFMWYLRSINIWITIISVFIFSYLGKKNIKKERSL